MHYVVDLDGVDSLAEFKLGVRKASLQNEASSSVAFLETKPSHVAQVEKKEPQSAQAARLPPSPVHLAEQILDINPSIEEINLKKAKEMALVPFLQQHGDDQQINGLALCPEERVVGHYKRRGTLYDQQLENCPHIDIKNYLYQNTL